MAQRTLDRTLRVFVVFTQKESKGREGTIFNQAAFFFSPVSLFIYKMLRCLCIGIERDAAPALQPEKRASIRGLAVEKILFFDNVLASFVSAFFSSFV